MPKVTPFLISVLFSLQVVYTFGQLETSHWRFSQRAGLDFPNGGAPVPLNSPSLLPSGSWGSNACESDSAGNLLFYLRNYDLVYNKLGDTMSNCALGNYCGFGSQ